MPNKSFSQELDSAIYESFHDFNNPKLLPSETHEKIKHAILTLIKTRIPGEKEVKVHAGYEFCTTGEEWNQFRHQLLTNLGIDDGSSTYCYKCFDSLTERIADLEKEIEELKANKP